MEIPAINLKAILFVHWLLTIWGCMAWVLPSSYLCANMTVLAVGVWAVAQRDSVDAVLMFLLGMTLTIVTDIVHFGIFYSASDGLPDRARDVYRFSVGMAILSLILKPLSCFFVYQMYRERGGDYNINFGITVSRNRDAYQSIDHQQEPTAPSDKRFPHSENPNPSIRAY